jgi:hypothetical protein
MLDTFTPDPVALSLASRLKAARGPLSAKWFDLVTAALTAGGWPLPPAHDLIPHAEIFIVEIAERLSAPVAEGHEVHDSVMRHAAALGRLRFGHGATVYQLLQEYDALADVLEEFVLHEAARAGDMPLDDALRAMRRVTATIRALQRQTVGTFVAIYTDANERQKAQLIGVARLVGQEMRQPLSVLQFMPALLPVREGDMELTHLLALFDRNIRRLAKVAARLERLSHALTKDQ